MMIRFTFQAENNQPGPPVSLAAARLNSVAPAFSDRCARSRRNCMASPPLVGGGAARRIEFLSSVAVPILVRTAAGKDGAAFPSHATPWPCMTKRQQFDLVLDVTGRPWPWSSRPRSQPWSSRLNSRPEPEQSPGLESPHHARPGWLRREK